MAALSLTVILLVRDPWVALAGIGFMGIGLGNAIPVIYAASAREGRTPELGISAVAIGMVANVTSLPIALFIVVALCMLAAAGASAVKGSSSATSVRRQKENLQAL